MKAVMSFWTKPSRPDGGAMWKGNAGFPNRYYFAVSLWLSFMLARQWFKRVEIYTDAAGAEFLHQTKIPFSAVYCELDKINHIHPELWAYGKVFTYSLQEEPFLHLDYDVYLVGKPEKVFTSNVITQNVEQIHHYHYKHRIAYINRHFKNLPKEWSDYEKKAHRCAYNVGIIGGLDYKSLVAYAEKSMSIITENFDVVNRERDNGTISDINVVYEQYFLSAYMNTHGKQVDTLIHDFFARNHYKYEHYIADSKSDVQKMIKAELFLRKHFPQAWNRLNQIKKEL